MLDLLTNYGTLTALILRIIAFGVCLIFVMPLVVKQARVKNGLRVLRLCLLAYGITTILNNLLTSYFLFEAVTHGIPQKLLSIELQVINAIFVLIGSAIGYIMYHLQYTDEEVAKHARIDKMDIRDAKRAQARKLLQDSKK